ncbi:MAG: 16S rRNA processing protein RimM [Deltaproteobacteria bacterium]|nr:16S rRNA processing protein RimM [Deltaproteobacteria bacterium]
MRVASEDLLLIGKVIRPHGLNGLLRIHSYAVSPETFLNPGIILLKTEQTGLSEYKVISVNSHRNAYLMKLDGISSLDDAERFRGAELFIRKDTLRREGADEYFRFELIGVKVFLDSGRFLGTLREIIDTGSNDIYVVKEGDNEFLIPALHGVVLKIDLENKRMIIAGDIDGLLDIDEV